MTIKKRKVQKEFTCCKGSWPLHELTCEPKKKVYRQKVRKFTRDDKHGAYYLTIKPFKKAEATRVVYGETSDGLGETCIIVDVVKERVVGVEIITTPLKPRRGS